MTKSHADMTPAPPATAAPCTIAIVTSRVSARANSIRATISAVSRGSCLTASCKSRPVQNAFPAPRRIRMRCSRSAPAFSMAAASSLINSIVSAFRRSGRLSVSVVICGVCFSIRTTGIHYFILSVTSVTMESVKLIECPRDAWQGLPRRIPTERKIEYLGSLIAAGFRHIDAVSFVSPKAVPQMADSEEVLAQLGWSDGVEIIGIVVNEKGAERAIATKKVTTLGYPCSISETFLRRNQNQSLPENLAVLRRIKAMADETGLGMVAYISMAFGNPYGDAWSEENLLEEVAAIREAGIKALSLADTVGAAEPGLIARVLATVLGGSNEIEMGVHLPSTRAGAAAKVLAAFDAGCRRFESAMGGLGGCPVAQDHLAGNIPTEEVLRALEQRGASLAITGVQPGMAMNNEIARPFGREGPRRAGSPAVLDLST